MKLNKFSRRDAIKKGALGVAALSTIPLAGFTNPNEVENSELNTDNYWNEKSAFITGGARGIGLASAVVLAKKGVNIVLFDVAEQIDGVNYALATESDLASAKKTIEALGVKCVTIKGDVRDSKSLKSAVSKTVETFGSLDFLVVNAGVTQVGLIDYFPDNEVQIVNDINVVGAIKTVQAALPQMRKQKFGRIVFVSSQLGRMGNNYFPVYASTKWAVIGLTKSIASLVATENITSNVICPGLVDTKLVDNEYFLKGMSPQNPTMDALNEMMKQWSPMKTGALKAENIGTMISRFFDEEMCIITGEVLDVSAGASANWMA
ncbi:MAG: NAD(P)-dependent dehydrogenase (short-subunit alcohol dehydrogenase family) [Sediminicola sp.]|jgi:NAD(P)-dependent dehydrogenase (short-subunit alcohol dehydrogenase family)|tara:strand:- start:1607 stop:2566 length:960 start_codon:yes stop_codon:yes gene_type:complete